MTITTDNYSALAAKFEVARYGNGPGISDEDLASVGLKKPKKYQPIGLSWEVDTSEWTYLCCFVAEKLSGKAFVKPTARGRGFRSQQAGEEVVKVLTQLAEAL